MIRFEVRVAVLREAGTRRLLLAAYSAGCRNLLFDRETLGLFFMT